MKRRKFRWSKFQLNKLNRVLAVLERFKEYKPLTLRQIFYQLISENRIRNVKSEYTMLSGLCKWGRISGHIPWPDIEDRTRAFYDLSGWKSKGDFIERSLDSFLTGYRRDLLQSQDKFIEICVEKDALSSIFTRAAGPYGVSVLPAKGFNSVSALNEYRDRVKHWGAGKKPVLLYFGDFDPSGMAMLEAMQTTLKDEMDLPGVEYKRVALLEKDIADYNLPYDPDAIKKKDSRTKEFVKKYGPKAVELDALPPDVLTDRIKKAIEAELDMGAFDKEVEKHLEELKSLDGLIGKTRAFVEGEI